MNAKRKALLDTLASDPYNGESAEALAFSGHAATTIRTTAAAGLIERFTKNYSKPPGLKVTCYRITEAGKLARMQNR
jgi:hypothetical protein